MRWIWFAVVCLVAAPAAAQFTGGYLAPTMDSPDILCNIPNGNCKPLNIAACSDTSVLSQKFKVVLPAIPSSIWLQAGTSAKVFVWIQPTTTAPSLTVLPVCQYTTTTLSQVQLVASWNYATNLWPFTGSSFTFPDDYNNAAVSSTTLEFTAGDVMNATGIFSGSTVMKDACTSQVSTTYVLCFGIDSVNNTNFSVGGDGQVDGTSNREATSWAQFLVDTTPPGAVDSAKATGKKGHITVDLVSAAAVAGDRWNVKIRPLAAGASPDTTSACSSWVSSTTNPVTTATGDAIGSSSVDLTAVNGTTYEGCADLLDQVGNEGSGSAYFTATPFDQCDFAQCYPTGQLNTGFCAAVAPAPLGAAALLLLLRRRRREGVQR